jgi:hypothetical protein
MSAMDQGAAPPSGSWTHSFEEDEPGGILVYRPTHSFAFPPTRAGRDTIVFGAGGELTAHAQGPDDRMQAQPGRWIARGMNRFTLSGAAGTPERAIEIIEAGADILKIRKH